MVYVDDLMVMGRQPQLLFDQIREKVLLKSTGTLKTGSTISFLGRRLRHNGEGVELLPALNYIEELLEEHHLHNARPATTPGTKQLKAEIGDGVSELTSPDATMYRRAVGKLMWLTPIRPDINYSVKELSRQLTNPTVEDVGRLRHLLRYLKGTLNYSLLISPKLIPHKDAPLELDVYVDSDWAGCRTTRKSTSGAVISVLGTTIHHYSRTQNSTATSSAEAELYAIGSGTAEGLGVVNFLREACLMKKGQLNPYRRDVQAD